MEEGEDEKPFARPSLSFIIKVFLQSVNFRGAGASCSVGN